MAQRPGHTTSFHLGPVEYVPYCIRIGQLLSIHSSLGGLLGSFHLLTIVNSAFTHILVRVLFEHRFSILWDLYLGVELLGHMTILFKSLMNHQTDFHSSFIPFCIRGSSIARPKCPHILNQSCWFGFISFRFVYNSHPSGLGTSCCF